MADQDQQKKTAGIFITFEGGDGAGKTTHITFLASCLRAMGHEVICLREPGGTSVGEDLRAIVLDPKNAGLCAESELLIYEAARAQIIREVIIPALARGAVVLFRHIPTTEASGIISQNTGVSAEQARIAVEACNGSVTKAIGFCKSPEKTGFRRRILEILTLLPLSDERDVLEYAAELVKSAKAWVDVVQSEQAEAINESEEFLSKAALKQIEARNKRVLTKASLESLAQVTSIIRSWLRDVLMIKSQAVEQIVNIDVMNDLEQAAARTTPAGLVRAIDATYRCDKAIAYNVSTETCLDTLLFTIREVFYGSGGSH